MNGVAKVIDELGKMIIAKEVIIDSQKEEINKLLRKIETIEQCINTEITKLKAAVTQSETSAKEIALLKKIYRHILTARNV